MTNRMMNSHVMSALTATIGGKLMTSEEVAVTIIRNGWATPGDDILPAVRSALAELREQGTVLDLGHDRYDLSAEFLRTFFTDSDEG